MKTPFIALPVAMAALITGCGTVSHVSPVANQEMNLQKFQRVVVVLDFADGVTEKTKPKDQTRKKSEMTIATKAFPDRIAVELDGKNAFREVVRSGTPDEQTLVISGIITRYEEGSSAARYFIGMGAGSSYFDATVEFKDGVTLQPLATQKVDKNSWGLGGGFAATQTPDTFMREAARKLAEDVASLKLTGKVPERKAATSGKK